MTWRNTGRVEKIIALEILALIAYWALPALRDRPLHQRAQRIAADVRRVTAAAAAARERLGAWPEDEAPGHVPAALAPFLPAGFTFERADYSLDWDQWRLRDGRYSYSPRRVLIGVSVTTRDPRLTREVLGLMNSAPMHFTVENRSMFPISDPELPTP